MFSAIWKHIVFNFVPNTENASVILLNIVLHSDYKNAFGFESGYAPLYMGSKPPARKYRMQSEADRQTGVRYIADDNLTAKSSTANTAS